MGILCPRCHRGLRPKVHGNVTMMVCPGDDGAWFDAEALKAVLAALK